MTAKLFKWIVFQEFYFSEEIRNALLRQKKMTVWWNVMRTQIIVALAFFKNENFLSVLNEGKSQKESADTSWH